MTAGYVLSASYDGYLLISTSGQILGANAAYCQRSGYSHAELLKMNTSALQYSPSKEHVQNTMDEATKAGHFEFETKHKRKNGSPIELEVRITYTRVNERPCFVCTLQDLTSKKRVQEDLRKAHQKLQSHLGNSPLGIVEYTKDFTVTQWSKKCEEIFVYSDQDMIVKVLTSFQFVYESDTTEVTKVVEELMSGRVESNISINRNYTKSRKIIDCICYNSAFKD